MTTIRLFVGLGLLVLFFGLEGCGGEVEYAPAVQQIGSERVRGTRVHLVRPSAWDPAPSFAGFMNVETQSTVMVMEMDGPFDEVAKGFNDKRVLASQKMAVVERVPFAQGSYPGWLLQMTQKNGPVPVRKWVWLFGDAERSVMVMGVCSEGLPQGEYDLVGKAVRSASWEPGLVLDPAQELDFFLGDDGGMQPMGIMTSSLTYNSDGEIDKDGVEGKPFFIVVPAIAQVPVSREKHVTRRMKLTAGHKKVKPGVMLPITVDGLSGFECIATSTHRKSEEPSFIYQVMLFEGSSYWNMTGIGRERDRAQYLPIFKRMARSFQRKFETLASADGKTSMEIPKTWTLRNGLNDEADIQAGQPIAETYAMVLSEAKADGEEGLTFDDYKDNCRADFGVDADSFGEATAIKVGGMAGDRVEFRMAGENVSQVFQHVILESADNYHQVILWCLVDGEEYAMPALERALNSFSEVQ